MRQPINNTSRVPAYLRGRKMAVSAFSCVEPSNIGEGRDGVDVFASFCARKEEEYLKASIVIEERMFLKKK